MDWPLLWHVVHLDGQWPATVALVWYLVRRPL